ncbi:MAG: PAS domain S-box protein [Chitinophagaceae bacterium]
MNKKINILHLEDLKNDAQLVALELKKGKINCQILVVETKEKFIKALANFSPDIILSDHNLPSFNSQDALSLFHETGLKIPFILVTVAMSDEFAVDMLMKGADDYLVKDRLSRLPVAINNALEKFRLRKESQLSLDLLTRNEKHFRALIENIDDAIVLIDAMSVFIYQSPSATRLSGYAFDDLKTSILFEHIHADDLPQCLAAFIKAGQIPALPLSYQFRMRHQDGHYFLTEGTITNLLHDESVNAFILNYRDITQRSNAEEAINISRLFAESIVSTIRDPIIILTKRFAIRSANTSFYKKFNTSEEVINGQVLFNIGNKQWSTPALRSQLENVLTERTTITDFEFSYEFAEVGKRILLLNACAIQQDSFEEPCILLTISDITEQRILDNELKCFSERLEQQVLERTLLLYEANKNLQHSNKNLEQFAFVASHDLQEPLRKIRTYASLLHDQYKNFPAEALELVCKISTSAERMATLIQQLLNFSKILKGDSAFEKADLNEIMCDLKIDFELAIAEKKAVIVYDTLPTIDVIPLQINQLFHNIISNSLKFSKTDTNPVISISSTLLTASDLKKHADLDQNLTYVQINIKDNGIGFEQQFSEKVFLIFQRLNSRSHFTGTGVGLALCKAIAINHHGEIAAFSKQNEGALFTIILPLHQKKGENGSKTHKRKATIEVLSCNK